MAIDLKTLDALSAYNKVGNLTSDFGGIGGVGKTDPTGGPSFTQLVEEALGKTVDKVRTAEAKTIGATTGEVSTEDLAIAVANAELSLKTVIAIRDKLITAFQDILRMPI